MEKVTVDFKNFSKVIDKWQDELAMMILRDPEGYIRMCKKTSAVLKKIAEKERNAKES